MMNSFFQQYKLLRLCGLLLLSILSPIFAGDDSGYNFQELFFNTGMSLSAQNKITNWQTYKSAMLNVCYEVEEVDQIVNFFLSMNDDLVEKNIASCESLLDSFDFFISDCLHYQVVKKDFIDLAIALQDVFNAFKKLHPFDANFETFSAEIASDNDQDNSQRDCFVIALNKLDRALEPFSVFFE